MSLHNADYETLCCRLPEGETTVNGMAMRRSGWFVAALLLAGCPEETPLVDASLAIDAGSPTDAGILDAGPPLPTELLFTIDFVGVDGGVSSVASSATTAQIDPARMLLIQFPTALKDYRVRVFDGAEQVLPSDEEARAADGGLSYQIVLAGPLKPGRSYSFSVEAELGHEITDMSGRGYRDVRMGLKVRGEPEPEPKKKPGKKRRK